MKAIIYGAAWCHACHQAAAWLRAQGVEVEERDYTEAPGEVQSLPVISIGGEIVVGFNRAKLSEVIRRYEGHQD
ncbi:MAG TPA: glutaredoxin family protein [Firmicutes bacterium]|nr:glutaredoxin family protein [Candidatus Fermentithermobacillaceae bacterium]